VYFFIDYLKFLGVPTQDVAFIQIAYKLDKEIQQYAIMEAERMKSK